MVCPKPRDDALVIQRGANDACNIDPVRPYKLKWSRCDLSNIKEIFDVDVVFTLEEVMEVPLQSLMFAVHFYYNLIIQFSRR